MCFQKWFLQNAKAITERAHRWGRWLYSMLSIRRHVPFSVKDLEVDFATGVRWKWLCGGPGAGYLYVRPDLQTQLQPKTTGWMRRRAFCFDTDLRYAIRLQRFFTVTRDSGTIRRAVGLSNYQRNWFRENSRQEHGQTERLIELSEEAGFRVTSPKNAADRGGNDNRRPSGRGGDYH